MTPQHIPDEDDVCRHLFEPRMRQADGALVWHCVFQFKTEDEHTESVVWCRYAPTSDHVHRLGCEKQHKDRTIGRKSTYCGAIKATVGTIRRISSKNGLGFDVVHDPSNDQGDHHAHIQYTSRGKTLTKADKLELKELLRQVFSEPDEHRCPDLAGAAAA